MTVCQAQYLMAIDWGFEIVLQMCKPVRRANNRRRSLTDDGVGKTDAIGRCAILDFLIHRAAFYSSRKNNIVLCGS
jgi:hypothetical protein